MSQATTAMVASPASSSVDLYRRGIGTMLSMQARLTVVLMGVSQALCKASGSQTRFRDDDRSKCAPQLPFQVSLANTRKAD
jgi:hypothetical protein